ncbi:DUF3037 domain-containing protein [Olivibacter sp. CPCC 100613]|uniref:DUF3037 domain-containing protein n=1 Tax=Olivibacter sp. CPCC 100613 TaxID=3079931 RepID=UPI002FFD421E
MKTFQYQILRFQPDKISGEFLNLGVVIFDPSTQALAFDILRKAGGVSDVFHGINTRYLSKQLNYIATGLSRISKELLSEFKFQNVENIEELTKTVFPKDDSSLFFSEVRRTLDMDIQVLTEYLGNRLISLAHKENDKDIKSDKEVWTKIYKKYFDDLNISKYLTPVVVPTKFGEINFDHSWRNGHLNFFEAVNFDLEKTESIKQKAYRWAGQIDELVTADEKIHLYLLAKMPEKKLKNKVFVEEFLSAKSSQQVKVEIVTPENAVETTSELQREILTHE